ncbi:MAG TPA: SPOR domain-containing protein [Gemmatimonadales bacterium]|nr:SPOR domain-containing protein [Gemmatimonadales bacterium]
MNGPHLPGAAALALCLAACAGGNPHRPAGGLDGASQPLTAYSLLRLPRGGGEARLHALPGLARLDWRSRARLPKLAAAVGADLDQRVAFVLAADGGALALDLETGTLRPVLPEARRAVLGPDRTLWAVDGEGGITAVARRVSRQVAGRPPAGSLYGTAGGQLLALADRAEPRAVLLGAGDSATTADLPAGPAAVTEWGDLVGVAADTALVLWHPAGGEVTSIRFRRGAVAVAFSPAGHRAYVLTDGPRLDIVDREREEVIGSVELPGTGRAVRADPLGAWLLVRAATGDDIWLVDPVRREVAGMFRAEWAADLPTVVGGGVIVARQGADVVALSLAEGTLPEAGRVAGGAADIWLPLGWTPPAPRGGAPEAPAAPAAEVPAAEAADPDAEPAPPAERRLFLQLSSSHNAAWAEDLAQQLRRAGVEASVLPPDSADGLHRVVLGPFATREEAEAAARGLGRPSFIFQRGGAAEVEAVP